MTKLTATQKDWLKANNINCNGLKFWCHAKGGSVEFVTFSEDHFTVRCCVANCDAVVAYGTRVKTVKQALQIMMDVRSRLNEGQTQRDVLVAYTKKGFVTSLPFGEQKAICEEVA